MNTKQANLLSPICDTASPNKPDTAIDLLLAQLIELNIKITLKEGNLHLNTSTGILSDTLKRQLKENKPALLKKLSNIEDNAIDINWPRLTADKEQQHQPFPLSDVQHAYWMGRNKGIEFGNVATHYYYELDCHNLDLARFSTAFNTLIKRHDMMRAIVTPDGEQKILESVPVYTIPIKNLRHKSEMDQQTQMLALRKEMSTQVHATDRWPLYDIRAIQLNDNTTRLYFSWDFLNLDAWSLYSICREWTTLYDNPTTTLPAIRVSYRDYILVEQGLRDNALYQRDRDYWRNRLESIPEAPQLPIKTDIDPNRRHTFTRRSFRLNKNAWQQLKTKGANIGITPSNILLTAYAEVLAMWSQQTHFTLNMTFFNRLPLHEDVYKMVGDFTSLILLEVDARQPQTFGQRALQLQRQFMRDFEHRMVSGIEVIREWSKHHGLSLQAAMPVVFTSCLVLNSEAGDDASLIETFGQQIYGISQTPQVWLDNQIMEDKGDLTLNWDAVEEVFAPGVLDVMFSAYCKLIEHLANDPAAWKVNTPVSLPSAQQAIRQQINQTQADISPCRLHESFIHIAVQQPDNIAIQTMTQAITYGELLARSCELAKHLESLGVGSSSKNINVENSQPELVAIVMDKGWQQVVAVMGILIAGGAYLPIDPKLPKARIDLLCKQSQCAYAVINPSAASVSLLDHISVVALNQQVPTDIVTQPPTIKQQREDLAYVLFTSGSTGIPKGVMINHAGAVNTIYHINQMFHLSAKDKILAVSSLSFDLSVYDIFGILTTGGTLVIPEAQYNSSPEHWLELINTYQVTLWNSAPPLMTMLLNTMESFQQTPNISLRATLLSGDWLPLDTKEKLSHYFPFSTLTNLGGSTEASIWSIYYPVHTVAPQWKSIPYGKPLPNQTVYVLNQRLQSCPDSVIGDIYIGGIGLAQGYLKNSEKTEKHFITHPDTGERLYYTGDLGRYHLDGNIELLGRSDSQVKVHGHRIELGEIAHKIRQIPGVDDAVVTIVSHGNDSQIAAFIVEDTNKTINAEPLLMEKETALTIRTESDWTAIKKNLHQIEKQAVNTKREALAHFSHFWALLEQRCLQVIATTLKSLVKEEQFSIYSLFSQQAIKERFKPLIGQWLMSLENEGYLIQDRHVKSNDQYYCFTRKNFPHTLADDYEHAVRSLDSGSLAVADYFNDCFEQQITQLEGYIEPVSLLFPCGDSDWSRAESLYQYNPVANIYNHLLAQTLAQLISNWPKGRPIRILEIGAGTGAGTSAILPVLPKNNVNYFYTDITSFFMEKARKKFSSYDYLHYQTLDLNQPISVQGYEEQSFDFVIAVNVLHDAENLNNALQNVKRLLSPGGTLLALEGTRNTPVQMATIGYLEGFSNYQDERKQSNLPLLSEKEWPHYLKNAGFESVAVLPEEHLATEALVQHVIVAQQPLHTTTSKKQAITHHLSKHLPPSMLPKYIHILKTLPKTTNGKIDYQSLNSLAGIKETTITNAVLPNSHIEKSLLAIWEAVLNQDEISVDSNFFDIGGDSLLLVSVRNKINQSMNIQLSTVVLFEHPTITTLSHYLETNNTTVSADYSQTRLRANKQREAIKKRHQSLSIKSTKDVSKKSEEA